MEQDNSTRPPDSSLQILVVEDSVPYAKLIIASLKHSLADAHEVQHADCCRSAVEALGTHRFDLIILDMYLPDSEGIDTFDAINHAAPNPPVIILSSDDSRQLAVEAVQRGALDYPIKGEETSEKLIASVRTAVSRKRSAPA